MQPSGAVTFIQANISYQLSADYIMFKISRCGRPLLTTAFPEQLMNRRPKKRLSSLGDYSLRKLMGQGLVTWRAEQTNLGRLLLQSGPSLARDEAVSFS